MLSNNKVSVIMPAFNSEHTIARAIESVLSQTYEDFELIIVDDASTDEVSMVVEKFRNDPRVVFLRNGENLGVAKSRNKAIKIAAGRYISFLDSDDWWSKNKLEKQLKAMKYHSAGVCHSSYERHKANSKVVIVNAKKRVMPRDMLITNHIGNLTGIYDVDIIGKVYQHECKHEDYVMWYEIILRAGFSVGVEESLAYYFVQPKSISSNKIASSRWHYHVLRQHFNIPMLKANILWFAYIFHALIKRM